jgi:triacylglycerol lipase
LVDPELLAILDRLPSGQLSNDTLAGVRESLAQIATQAVLQRPSEVSVATHFIESTDGARVRIVTYQPMNRSAPLPAILHFHGGGFVAGLPEMCDVANSGMALRLKCVVASVDYRLAPESIFPKALEDAYAALQWLTSNASLLAIDPERIAVAGESAGGGLAGSLALWSRDHGGAAIAHMSLVYPMLDDRTGAPLRYPFQGEFVWQAEKNCYGWRSFLGSEYGVDSVSPYAALGRARDLEGLPSTFICVGALDLFLAEDLDFARRLAVGGVPTELHVYPGAYHGFFSMNSTSVAKAAQMDRLKALNRALNLAPLGSTQ